MSDQTRKELRYYVPLVMGFVIMMIALIAPPLGAIPTSAIYGGGIFLILCATVAGLDVPATLKEIRMLKEGALQHIANPDNQQE